MSNLFYDRTKRIDLINAAARNLRVAASKNCPPDTARGVIVFDIPIDERGEPIAKEILCQCVDILGRVRKGVPTMSQARQLIGYGYINEMYNRFADVLVDRFPVEPERTEE